MELINFALEGSRMVVSIKVNLNYLKDSDLRLPTVKSSILLLAVFPCFYDYDKIVIIIVIVIIASFSNFIFHYIISILQIKIC